MADRLPPPNPAVRALIRSKKALEVACGNLKRHGPADLRPGVVIMEQMIPMVEARIVALKAEGKAHG